MRFNASGLRLAPTVCRLGLRPSGSRGPLSGSALPVGDGSGEAAHESDGIGSVIVDGTAAASSSANHEVAVPKPAPLHVVVEPIRDPNPTETRARVLTLLADAIAEVLISEARGEVAARLGCSPEDIDLERRSAWEPA
jgi:hypothetical protein